MHERVRQLRSRGHSYRNFEPSEVRELLEDEDVPNADVRDFFKFMESGRFEPMLDNTHSMFCRLDIDEMETFWSRNPDIVAWMNVWAKSEDLMDFTDHNMVRSPEEQ